MRKITLNGIEKIDSKEYDRIFTLVFKEHSADFHYLAFDRQLSGFSPLGTYILDYPVIKAKEDEIMAALVERKEVESLYPEAKLSLYPVTKIDGPEYSLDLENCEKHFADILELNDAVYKTKYLYVDFGHGAENFDEALLIEKFSELLAKSNVLEAVYIEEVN